MFSHKWTFSLTFLVVMLAFGLAFYTPSVMADGATHDFSVTLATAVHIQDVSSADGMQMATGRDRASREFTDNLSIDLTITTGEIVNLAAPGASLKEREGKLHAGAIAVDAFDREGRSLGTIALEETDAAVVDVDDIIRISHRDPRNPGKEFIANIGIHALHSAYADARDRGGQGSGGLEIHTLFFTIAKSALNQADQGHVIAVRRGDHAHQHTSGLSNSLKVQLVDDDEGNPQYNMGVSANPVVAASGTPPEGDGTPGVVAVQKLLEREGFIETGDFVVKIILTEEPRGGLTTDLIKVVNGSAKSVAKGTSLKGALTAIDEDLTVDPPVGGQDTRESELTQDIAMYTPMDDGTFEASDTLPEATGRDNMYHQYFVTITPNDGLTNAEVVVSVMEFDDKVEPIANTYVPLTDAQIAAPTAFGGTAAVRNARVANESVTVIATTGAAAKTDATVAYEARQKVLDAAQNEISLAQRTIVPKDGYLVLAADVGKAGIQSTPAKPADKKTDAQKLYNTHGLGLPFPADDLDTFFRNGGTLNLGYADIAEATDSGHGDAAANGDTGYTGATTDTYDEGDVIFNEIMWGLDGARGKESQYIELRNMTGKDLGIDSREWVISVGALPEGYTPIDSVGNTSPSWWQVPGDGGNTAASAENPTVEDLVSMSRVDATASGTAEANWARSKRPSANLSGRRIGTPGAANIPDVYGEGPTVTATAGVGQITVTWTAVSGASYEYSTDSEMTWKDGTSPLTIPGTAGTAITVHVRAKAVGTTLASTASMASATPTAAAATPPTPIDGAVDADIMITEIMVDSGNGRFPQWIELTSVAAGEVSLDGWTLVIENHPDDEDVLGDLLVIDLNGITLDVSKHEGNLGKGQSALIVAFSGRGSGNLEDVAIIDASSEDQLDQTGRYLLLSETAFTLTLVPPQESGKIEAGDVAGNLENGAAVWALEMAEGMRSSLIRRETDRKPNDPTHVASMDFSGTSANGWRLASMTDLASGQITWYGSDDDAATPGYDAGGPLPVELSLFYPKRDQLTGQVVIKWETQSELNNAGFFIKRSQQKDGEFEVINPTMIQGAGTTSEKQSYTYTDTTAKPNVIYFYQIEDVSLDGQRQTLTLGTRLRGHIGAAGKATTTWGELKSQ